MVRLVLFLLGLLTGNRPSRQALAWQPADGSWGGGPYAPATAPTRPYRPANPIEPDPRGPRQISRDYRGPEDTGPDDTGTGQTDPQQAESDGWPPAQRPGPAGPPPRRPRRVPRWAKWAGVIVAGLIFRKAIAWLVLAALSAALHLVGVDVHLPSVKFGWPWHGASALPHTTTTNVDLGPWVLQKIEGISKPALGQVNFNFLFTHKVSKNIGFWPCWYSSTFYAVGHASATVNLNPGPAWWAPATDHYQLQVLSRPAGAIAGRVAVVMDLPQPQLPQSVNDVTIDNLPSKPVATQHSWTYPGFGCGVLLRPQFAESVLYAEAQELAFYRSTHVASITRPMIAAAETQATTTIRNNFIQPTLNAFGYTLESFSIRWVAPR
jgi:hypothetical protein